MNIGKMRHRITIQSPVTGQDPFNTSSQGTWNNVATVWASIAAADNRKVWYDATESMQVSHVITMRYPGTTFQVAAGDQVLYGTRVFQVQKGIVNPDEHNILLMLYVWEVNPTQGQAVMNG